MTAAIVWLVLWLVLTPLVAWLTIVVFVVSGVGISDVTRRMWPGVVAGALGYILGIGWAIFGAVQVILQIISVVQLAAAGG